jgi:hypothetical protein
MLSGRIVLLWRRQSGGGSAATVFSAAHFRRPPRRRVAISHHSDQLTILLTDLAAKPMFRLSTQLRDACFKTGIWSLRPANDRRRKDTSLSRQPFTLWWPQSLPWLGRLSRLGIEQPSLPRQAPQLCSLDRQPLAKYASMVRRVHPCDLTRWQAGADVTSQNPPRSKDNRPPM